MQISAHDIHNQLGSIGNSAITTSTPAWGHMWHAQANVSAAQVKVTGGTYAMVAPEPQVDPVETADEAPETPKKSPGRPRKAK